LQRKASSHLILSPENEVVRRLRRLARRREPGFAFLEGPRVVAEAVAAGVELELLVIREGDECAVDAARRVTLARGLFRSISQTMTPQGVVAIAKVRESTTSEAIAAARTRRWPLVVLDGVQDPGNVGAICRSAAAAGAPAMAVMDGSADPFGAKSVRASAGNVFRLTIARAAWDELAALEGYGAAAAGGTPLAESPIENAGMIVLGSEAHGLSRSSVKLVTIPLSEGVESLNVAAAAALLLFEVRRRRAA
jgi:RNA methyltransferase, TrmH family